MDDSRSTHDHLLFMTDESIDWKLSKQTSVASLITETEYMSQASTVTNVMWARRNLKEMGIRRSVSEKHSTIIYVDNHTAVKLTNNSVFQKRIKHIAVKYLYTRDLVSQKTIKLEYRLVAEMIADNLIKSFRLVKFKRYINQLSMIKKRSTW